MIAFFRKLSQSWVARVLFAILAVAFVAYLPGQLHGKLSTDDVITAGPRTVDVHTFKTEMEDEKKGMEAQQTQGQVVPWEVLQQQGVLDQMVQDLANDTALSAWMRQIGLRPSDKVITDALQKAPGFFNPVTGAFDRNAYDQRLAEMGVTEAQEEEKLKDQVAREHFISAMRSGFVLPRLYGAVQAATLMQNRDISWFVVGQKSIQLPGQPTDADLTKFIAANSDRLRIPEMRTMTAVMFAPGAVAKTIQVSDADLQKLYNASRDKLSTPETRSFVVIPAKTQQAAAQVASSLKAGGDPNIVARTAGVNPVSFDNKPKATVPDEAVAAQAFSMQVGEVSPPVHGALGWAVIKVNSITPGKTVSFEEAKPKLQDQLVKPQVTAKIDDLVDQYQRLREKGVSMADAAKQLGLPMQTFPPFTKEGRGPNGQPYTGPNGQPFTLPKPMLDALFSKPKGSESSEPEDAGNGLYYAMHVDEVAPAHLPQLTDQNRAALAQVWTQREILTREKAVADAAAQRVRKGEDLAAVARSVNADLVVRAGETYPRQQNEPDAQIRAMAFQTTPKDAFSVETQDGFVVGKTTAVHPPVTSVAASVTDRLSQQMASNTFGSMGNQAYQAVRRKLKVKIDNTLVDQALNINNPNVPKKQ
ncbi:MAG TPA: peptidyl-prolyl cis-trans isomerase [Caulobacteraceae bacterium]|jgi:peptidyl-prolyl cis-trans isomerase D|nr:peptidyl-prolyl cis-trans isomerase [Caulobacteraceae bacterium]